MRCSEQSGQTPEREATLIPISAQEQGTYEACDTTGRMLALIGGAGLGAIAMYLLDPSHGGERRGHIGELAGGAWETISEKTADLGKAAAAGASAFGSTLSAGGRAIADTETGGRISDAASGFSGQVSDRFRYLMHGRQSRGIESGFSQAMIAVGVLALGGTSMYFLDPTAGARRRAVCRDKFLSAFGRMATSLEGLGQDLYNRASGLVAGTRGRMSRQSVDDRVLHERIRSQMGRCVSNVGPIHVSSNHGVVTLTGPILAHEVDGLLKCVWSTRGVTELINRLTVYSDPNEFHRAVSIAGQQRGPATFPSSQYESSPGSSATSMPCPNPT
jgi:osmotically-inducible protein OsmY